MAVTLAPTLTLTSSTTTGDQLSFTVTDSLTLGDNDARISTTYSPPDAPNGVQIFDTNLGKSYIYLKNLHATLPIYIMAAADTAEGAEWMLLGPSEFAFFPWSGVVDLFASTGDATTATATAGLEVMIFEA